jgi:glycerol-3-phosphate dehydrogenase
MTFLHQDDKRGVYVYPWEGTTVIGTTDLDHHEDLDIEASISDEETNYLLDAFNSQFPNNALTRGHILSTWAGVRPVIGAENSKNPSKERRDHAVWTDKGLVTVSGGKLTTFRLIALDALAAAEINLPSPKEFVDDCMFPTPSLSSDALLPENTSLAQRLLGRYGEKAKILLENSTANERLTIEETEFSLAECRWAIRNEAVQHLDDLLLRRTRLGMCLPNGGDSIFPALKELFFSERNWDDELWQKELDRYRAIWQRHYSLPQKG